MGLSVKNAVVVAMHRYALRARGSTLGNSKLKEKLMPESTLPLVDPTALTSDELCQVSGGQSIGMEMEEAINVPLEPNPLIKNSP